MGKLVCIRFLKALVLFAPIVFFVLFAQSNLFYHDDYTTYRLYDFYKEPPHSLDVVLIGASETFTGYSPVHAYAQTGLTSYPYCFDAAPSFLYPSALKEVLSQQSPQLILVEVQCFLEKDRFSESVLRLLVENMPFSKNKLNTILQSSFEDKLSLLVPFFKYHSQWQMTADEFSQSLEERSWKQAKTISRLKGVMTRTDMNAISKLYPEADDDTCLALHPQALEALTVFMDECKANNLDHVVFVRFPHTVDSADDYERFLMANEVGRIVEEHGFQFLPLHKLTEDIGLDPVYDQYDVEHMNVSGQIKLTEYLASWMADEYGLLPMEQTEENAQYWDECIPYIEAHAEIALEFWEAGLHEMFYEIPPYIQRLDERIASWYAGGL